MGDVVEMVHGPTVVRCIEQIGTGLNVHKWMDRWATDERWVAGSFHEAIAIAFYHQALQDARQALADLQQPEQQ